MVSCIDAVKEVSFRLHRYAPVSYTSGLSMKVFLDPVVEYQLMEMILYSIATLQLGPLPDQVRLALGAEDL